MSGSIELYRACRRHGIKPIFGCEIYLSGDELLPGSSKVEHNHLTLLAENQAGYRNLMELSSAGFLEGLQRGKPTVDLARLARHSDGVIALTGCLASRFCKRLAEDRPDDARAHADELRQIFGPRNVYFEVQRNGIALQDRCNAGIVAIANEMSGALVGTGDVHYLRREDYDHHAALLCVQTKTTLDDPRRLRFETNEFYLRDSAEMADAFAGLAPGGREHRRDRRALRGGPRARRPADPELPDARRERRTRLSARTGARRDARALRRSHPGRGHRTGRHGARRDRPHGLQRVLPDRLGLRQVRPREHDSRGSRTRLGGGIARLLLPAHHRHRAASLRAPLRALPEPRARLDARHRHRLLGARA